MQFIPELNEQTRSNNYLQLSLGCVGAKHNLQYLE